MQLSKKFQWFAVGRSQSREFEGQYSKYCLNDTNESLTTSNTQTDVQTVFVSRQMSNRFNPMSAQNERHTKTSSELHPNEKTLTSLIPVILPTTASMTVSVASNSDPLLRTLRQ
jgi:hypothetical protein